MPLTSSDGEILRIYGCGPTVYRDAHVGNMRTFLLSDIVIRLAKFIGYKVKFIQNITDVGHMSEDFIEDKMLAQAKKESKDPYEIARIYEARFHSDLKLLNINPADNYPKASECIDLMHDLISKLITKGHAYVGSDNCVYFSAQSFEGYGAISGNRLDSLKPGHRFEYTEDGAKRFHADWALWKAAENRTEMIWNSPWGKGFPGWHIECSAMSLHYLNNFVDLHLGGIDLRFPHHENERAQSNCVIDREAVSLWMHGEHLLFEGRKMAKSAGNVVLVSDLIDRNLDPLCLRMDMQMPGMDGVEATRVWRTREEPGRHVHIIAMTANVLASDREVCLEAGMDDFIGKPVHMDDLRNKLESKLAPMQARQ